MNKGFVYYLKRSWSQSFFAYRKLNILNRLKLSIFYLVCLFFSVIFFLRPIFSCAMFNAGKMVEETHSLSIGKCFEGAGKKFRELFISELYVFGVVAIITVLLFLPNLAAIMFPRYDYQTLYDIIRYATIGIAALLGIYVELKYASLPYIAVNSNELTAGDMIHSASKTKLPVTLKYLLGSIIFVLLAFILPAALIYGGYFVVNSNRANGLEFIFIIALVLGVVAWLIFGGIFMLMHSTFSYALFKDNVSNKKILIVKELSGNKIGYASIFPSERDDYTFLEDEDKEGK